MVTGTSVKASKEALRLTRIYPNVVYSTAGKHKAKYYFLVSISASELKHSFDFIGIHPHDAKSYTDESWEELKCIAENPECVAIGECGLDYNRNFSEPGINVLCSENM